MSYRAIEMFHAQTKAALSGDLNAMVSLFAEDAVVMPPNDSALYGKAAILAWWEEYFQYFRVTSSVETEHEQTIAGDQLFDRRAVSVTIVPKGTRRADTGRHSQSDSLEASSRWQLENLSSNME